MVVPLHTKWMLVWEDPQDASLTLCKATPRAWLAHGNTIGVENAPIRGGRISFNITSNVGDGTAPFVTGTFTATSARVAGGKGTPITLRLRVPLGLELLSASINGDPWSAIDVKQGEIHLPAVPPIPHALDVVAKYRNTTGGIPREGRQ